MATKSNKSKAINAVLASFISALFIWVKKWQDDAFFFIVIGDKTCTNVAWYNTEKLMVDGAFAVKGTPDAAGAFQNLATSVDILMEDQLKDEKFKQKYEQTSSANDDNGWHSWEFGE